MIKKACVFFVLLFIMLLFFASCSNADTVFDLKEESEWPSFSDEPIIHDHDLLTYANYRGGHNTQCNKVKYDLCDYSVDEPHKPETIERAFYFWAQILENGYVYHTIGLRYCADCRIEYERCYHICKNNSLDCTGECMTEEEWEVIIGELE